MQALLAVARRIDALMDLLGTVCFWLVNFLLLVGIYNVFARYIGRYVGVNLASNTLIEGQWYLFSIIFFLGFAFILRRNSHVRVDFLYQGFSERRRALINLIGTVFFLIPFCVLAIWVTTQPVVRSWGLQANGQWGAIEWSSDPGGLPRAPIKTMIIVAFVLLLIQAISEIIKHSAVLANVVSDEEIKELEHYEQVAID
jgi:TRAP-type mannitol/chloroaromatic compound transport system permease small subunit